MNQDVRDLLHEFVDAEVRFLVVGAYALAIHGRPRATGDLDLWVDPTPANVERLHGALQRFGAPLVDLTMADLTTAGVMYEIGVAPWRIDIRTAIDGVTFSDAWPRRARGVYEDVTFPVIGRADLLRNKRPTGRPKDEVDAQLLDDGDTQDLPEEVPYKSAAVPVAYGYPVSTRVSPANQQLLQRRPARGFEAGLRARRLATHAAAQTPHDSADRTLLPFRSAYHLCHATVPELGRPRPHHRLRSASGEPARTGMVRWEEILSRRISQMLTKRTSKNQVTIPKAVADQFPDVEHFEVGVEDGRIILSPVLHGGAEAVREKLASLGIGEDDVAEAIRWARRP